MWTTRICRSSNSYQTLTPSAYTQRFLMKYASNVPGTLIVNGGRIISKVKLGADATSGGPLLLSGTAFDYDVAVLMEFPTPEEATLWKSSKDYLEIESVRLASTSGPFSVLSGTGAHTKLPHASAYFYGFVKATADFATFSERVEATLVPYEGQCFVGSIFPDNVALNSGSTGTDYDACFVFGFPSAVKAMEWYGSDEFAACREVLEGATTGPMCLTRNFENH